MSSIIFDTHLFVKRLTEAGMNERQAEILAEEQAKLIDERLVTKQDLKIDLRELEYRMIIKLGSLMTLMSGIVVALIKLT